jgi:hypothetical protein
MFEAFQFRSFEFVSGFEFGFVLHESQAKWFQFFCPLIFLSKSSPPFLALPLPGEDFGSKSP